MWQAPNQRVGAMQNSKKRQQDRLSRPMHIKRVRAEARLVPHQETHAQATAQSPQGQVIELRALLNDLSPHGIGLYSSKNIPVGAEIQIVLDEPRRIQFVGKVMWSQEQAAVGPIIRADAFNFRLGVKFHFANAEEENAAKEFCTEVEEKHLYLRTD